MHICTSHGVVSSNGVANQRKLIQRSRTIKKGFWKRRRRENGERRENEEREESGGGDGAGRAASAQLGERRLGPFRDRKRRRVRVRVTSPAGNEVQTLKGTSGDKFEFKAPRSGMYKFCFHNPHSTPETVAFHIHIGHIPNEHNLAKDEHLDPINVKIAELREALESVTAEQQYLKARDARHRRTNDSTRKRVVFYTIGEYLLLACLSVLQVLYIRQLFSKSVGYNRV
ncbi:hypothetical protein RHSIM_Rhsim02G0029800 [Rhododendron simsii]|uniref:GOLD domain-containing protein n=1 Tax=Rhododendron simsii TaxID=118357 RepID=A0A834FUF8_RHOSS|nr:hypothetical protein RHSIM_RhsimUnG0184700 [Rhododendron simsii]KAF7116588.1 hypothetical protein RHSIM_RhsimUnG0023800 [Rhododendron simsii]KAF7150830.1 hypothetical protein RHSIM_Rhsim02G0029800 [Rhododendron simsii]